jgi:tRNA pseudouridine38-40 synthase
MNYTKSISKPNNNKKATTKNIHSQTQAINTAVTRRMKYVNFWWTALLILTIAHRKIIVSSFIISHNENIIPHQRHNNNNIRQSLIKVESTSTPTPTPIEKEGFTKYETDSISSSVTKDIDNDNDNDSDNDEQKQQQQQQQQQSSSSKPGLLLPLTSAILRISYDGSRFSGWSAANRNNDNNNNNKISTLSPSQQRRRRKRSRRRGSEEFQSQQQKLPKGFVRSVEGILKENLAKLYGNVDPDTRIVVEGCSRTDKGVHASYMIAQVYCLKKEFAIILPSSSSSSSSSKESLSSDDNEHDRTNATDNNDMNGDDNNDSVNTGIVIPGKRIPHPSTPTDDSCFEVLPLNLNLSRIAFTLNRMNTPDVQVTGIAPTPLLNNNSFIDIDIDNSISGGIDNEKKKKKKNIFHASLSSQSKIYEYRISTGYTYDPTLRKFVWHVGSSDLDLATMKVACELLQGTHNFSAFQGAPRGANEKQKRIKQRESSLLSSSSSTICTLNCINIDVQHPAIAHDDEEYYFPGVEPPVRNYNIIIKGDRFLYKMVRFIVGSLVAIGNGKLELDDIQRAIDTGSWDIIDDPSDRRKQFECAPAHGLVLTHVDYGDEVFFDWQPLREIEEEERKKIEFEV